MRRESRPSIAPILLGVLVVAVGVLPRFGGLANADVAWLSYLADELLRGANLYVDFVEVTPPPAVWVALPAALAGRVVPVDALDLFHLQTLLLTAVSLAFAHRVLRETETPSDHARDFLVLVGTVMLLVPGGFFAEREHLAALLIFPYLLALSRSHRESLLQGLGLGTMAGLGLALKPQFVLVAVAAETWRVIESGDGHELVRPSTGALIGVLGTCGAAVLLLEPEYLPLVGDLLLPYYAHMYALPWSDQLLSPLALQTFAAVLAALLVGRGLDPEAGRSYVLFSLVALVWLALAVIQPPALKYHFLPALLFGLVGLASALVLDPVPSHARPRRESTAGGRARHASRLAAIGALLLMMLVAAYQAGRDLSWYLGPGADAFGRLRTMVEDEVREPEPVIAGLNIGFWPLFPLLNESDARWGMRYPSVWPIYAARRKTLGGIRLEVSKDPDMGPPNCESAPLTEAEERFRDRIVSDLLTSEPDALFVPRREEADDFDVLRYFLASRSFARFFERYEQAISLGGYRLFIRRDTKPENRAAPGCVP